MLTDYHLHLRPDDAGTTVEEYHTAENVDRYLAAAAAAGIEELGVSEHVYRFRQALDLWRHPLWVENAVDDIDAYCEFVRTTPLRLGIECDFIPGAEERTEALLARPRVRLRRRLRPLRRRGRRGGRPRRLGRLGGERRRRRDLAALLRGARRVRPLAASSTSSPTRTWSRSGDGPGRCPSATSGPSTSRRSRPIARERDRGRDLDRWAAQAGRRALPGARLRRAVRRGGRPVRALLRRPPPRAGRLRLRPRAGVPRVARGGRDLRLRGPPPAPGAARRAGSARWSGSATTATASPPDAGWSSAGSRSSTSWASRATPTPTCSPTP